MLERFALAVSRRIGPSEPMPAVSFSFPAGHLVSHSCKLVKKSPLGHDFLAPAIMASYAWGEKQTPWSSRRRRTREGAAQRLNSFASYFGRSGRWFLSRMCPPGLSWVQTSGRRSGVFRVGPMSFSA